MTIQVLFICLLFITKFSIIAPHDIDRKLFQSENEDAISVSTINELRASLQNINTTTTNVITITENSIIELNETISIITNDTTITGQLNINNEKPIITCINNLGNILISGYNVIISNIEIRNCSGGPVVRIAENEEIVENGDDFKTVELLNLDFNSNSESEEFSDFKGGSLFIGEGNSVTIINSTFKDNLGEQGAGIYMQLPSELRIENSEFDNNVAEIAGGALYTEASREDGSYLEIKKSIFKNNGYTKPNEAGGQGCADTHLMPIESAVVYDFTDLCPTKGGGALFLQSINELIIEESDFEYNYGTNAAGAVFLRDIDDTYMRFCNFRSNSLLLSGEDEVSYGGAFYVLNLDSSSLFSLQHSTFFNNSAVHGGAFHFLATQGKDYFIENTDFNENNAQESGGAIVVRNKNINISGNRFNKNTAYVGGAMIFANGARGKFYTGLDENIDYAYSIFRENSAADGGAIAAIGSSSLSIIETELEGNAAGRAGGAIFVLETSINSNIDVRINSFKDNIAVKGGAFYGQSVPNLEMDENCTFTSNQAVSGGAIYLTAINSFKNEIILKDILFENNMVTTSYDYLEFPDTVKEYLSLSDPSPSEAESQNGNILLSKYSDDPCYPGGGGALCLQTDDAPDAAILHVTISNLTFIENSGYVGGAAMLVTKDVNRNICREEDCHYFIFDESIFIGNVANGSGGAIFAFSPEYIQDANREHNLIEKDKLSLIFENNDIKDGGYGRDIASGLASLKTIDEDPEALTNINSGEDNIVVKIGVFDAYDQHIVKAIQNKEQILSARSGSKYALSGTMDVKCIEGVSVFTLRYVALPGTYSIEFYVDDYDITHNVNITVRDCYVGETRFKDFYCERCEDDLYGFDPALPCYSCPENSICEGSQHLYPTQTFWHSSPFSPLMHRCLYKQACSFDNRMSILREIRNKNMNNTAIDNSIDLQYTNAECNEGYTGVLCASCVEGYAHKVSGECIKCEKDAKAVIIVALFFLWTFVLLFATVRSALTTVRDIHDLGGLASVKRPKKITIKKSIKDKIGPYANENDPEMHAESTGLTTGNMRDKITKDGISTEINEYRTLNQGSAFDPAPNSESFGDKTPEKLIEKQQEAKYDKIESARKISEMIKIFINFLKVTSVAVVINIKWTETVERMLFVQEGMSGFAGSSSLSSMECFISEDPQNRAFYGTIFRIFYPILISVVLLGLFSIIWFIVRFTAKKPPGLSHLTTRCTVVIVVTLFFSYDSITSYIMRILNCTEIDTEDNLYDSDPIGIQYFKEYSTANQTYWVEDPAFICYEGKHEILAYTLGIFGLIIFSVGVPVGLLAALIFLKYNDKLYDEQYINKIGFVYQAYKDQFSFWEVMILIRKAFVHIVVVFAYPLRENLQCIMLLGVMFISVILQLTCWPFEYTVLNLLETASLLVSILTFYFGLVFNDERSSDFATTTLSILLVFTTSSLFIAFIACIIQNLNNFLTAMIKMAGKDNVPDNFFSKVKCLISIKAKPVLDKSSTFTITFKKMGSNLIRSSALRSNKPFRKADNDDHNVSIQMPSVH